MNRALEALEFWVMTFLRAVWGHSVLCTGCCCQAGNLMLKGPLYSDGHFEPLTPK